RRTHRQPRCRDWQNCDREPFCAQRRRRHGIGSGHPRSRSRQTRRTDNPAQGRRDDQWRMIELLRFSTRMAWRDSRASRRKLALFSSSIILGVAALAAIGSFAANLRRAVEEQTKTLINADLILRSSTPFTPAAEAWFQTLGGEQSRGIVFNTMLYFPRTEGSHLVQLRSLTGQGSAYGQIETDPPAAAEEFRHAGGGVVIEESLLAQFGAKPGDDVRLGEFTTKV